MTEIKGTLYVLMWPVYHQVTIKLDEVAENATVIDGKITAIYPSRDFLTFINVKGKFALENDNEWYDIQLFPTGTCQINGLPLFRLRK